MLYIHAIKRSHLPTIIQWTIYGIWLDACHKQAQRTDVYIIGKPPKYNSAILPNSIQCVTFSPEARLGRRILSSPASLCLSLRLSLSVSLCLCLCLRSLLTLSPPLALPLSVYVSLSPPPRLSLPPLSRYLSLTDKASPFQARINKFGR